MLALKNIMLLQKGKFANKIFLQKAAALSPKEKPICTEYYLDGGVAFE